MPNPNDRLELVQVQVLMRHGARTPLFTCPGLDRTEWPPSLLAAPPSITVPPFQVRKSKSDRLVHRSDDEGQGDAPLPGGAAVAQLTQLGMLQCHAVGQRLRRRYAQQAGFLPSSYHDESVGLQSTNHQRTCVSLVYLVTGLFDADQQDNSTKGTADKVPPDPPSANQALPVPPPVDKAPPDPSPVDQVQPHPFPPRPLIIRVADSPEDEFLKRNLETFKTLINWQEFVTSNTNVIVPGYKDTAKKFLRCVKKPPPLDLIGARDVMLAQKAHGLDHDDISQSHPDDGTSPRLPYWSRVRHLLPFVDFAATQALAQITHGGYVPNPDILKMTIGPLWERLLLNMRSATTSPQRLLLFATHDLTLMPLLKSLEMFDEKIPPYAADVTIELHREKAAGEQKARRGEGGEGRATRGEGGEDAFWVQVLYCGRVEENLFGSGSSFVPLEFLALKIDSVLMSVEEKKEFAEESRNFNLEGKLCSCVLI